MIAEPCSSLPKVEQTGRVIILTFAGARVPDEEGVLARELSCLPADLARHELFLDFRNVSYVNSSDLGTLIALCKRAQAVRCQLVLFNVVPEVYEVFEITKLQTVLSIARSDVAREYPKYAGARG